MSLSLLPRELADQLALLPRDPHTGRCGLPGPLAEILGAPARSCPEHGRRLVSYRLLGALALSGWSFRRSLAHVVALGWLGREGESALEGGTYKRAYRALAESGLWTEGRAVVAGRPCVLVRLGERGRAALAAAGITCVESEWERMERAHSGGGENQLPHTACCCVFAHHARRLGYRTELLPDAPLPAQPDLFLARAADERRIYAEVQRRGGDPNRRRAKWANLAALQGFVAVCAERAADATRFYEEARAARLPGGLVTNIAALYRSELLGDRPGHLEDVWTHAWSGSGALHPYDYEAEG